MAYTEEGIVEKPIIEWLKELGWNYIPSKDLKRINNEELLLTDELKEAVKRINKDIEFEEDDLEFVIQKLKNIPPTLEGIKQFLDYFKNGMLIPLKKENREVHINIIDQDITNNSFIVTNQFKIDTDKGGIKPDIMLFINGIPLVLIEAKRREEYNDTIVKSWYDGYKDIKDYEDKSPDLFKYVQISIACDGEENYLFPNSYTKDDDLLEWKDPYPFKDIDDKLKKMVYGVLDKNNLLDIITNFIFINNKKGKKIMARYMQFRAANKIYNRVIDRLLKKSDKRYGLIWHWQGSGKTLTMAFSALKLRNSKYTDNPSIFVIVDRISLEEQVEREFKSIGIEIEKVNSIKELKDIILWGNKGKRGIFLSTIEKFDPNEFLELEKEVGKIEIDRENIIVLADEVHRTHYGKFSTMLRSIFSNASFFGFTGTPLSKRDRNTFKKFSEENELYLDRYSMIDALDDGVTVPISYTARLPEYHLKQEELDLLARYEEEVEGGLSKREKKILKKRIRAIRFTLLKDERLEAIVKDIIDHFKEVVEPTGMKAMIVAYDRLGCVRYKKIIDKFLDKDYSKVVMSYSTKEKEDEIRRYVNESYNEYKEVYGVTDAEDVNKKIKEDFLHKDKPKMLIVTDMLITGFDAPNLWAMYIDKPLKEHKLLQTIARTNRPYRNKRFGLIIDYIGIFDDLERSLKIFEADDEEMLKAVIRDLSTYAKEFDSKLKQVLSIFVNVDRDNTRDSLNKALEILIDPNKAKEFEELVKELMRYYEMLKGEAILKDYLNDYRWIISIYTNYNARYRREVIDYKKIESISKKTRELIEKSIDVKSIDNNYPIVEIDNNFIDKLKGSKINSIGAAIDIFANIRHEVNKHDSPFFLKLREEVERAYNELRKRRENVSSYIEKALEISGKIVKWKEEENKLGRRVHRIYEYVSNIMPDIDKEEVVRLSNMIINKLEEKDLLFDGWKDKPSVRRDVKREIKFLLFKEFKDHDKIDDILDAIFKALVDSS